MEAKLIKLCENGELFQHGDSCHYYMLAFEHWNPYESRRSTLAIQITAFQHSFHLSGDVPQVSTQTAFSNNLPELQQLQFSLNKQGADGHLEAQVSICWD